MLLQPGALALSDPKNYNICVVLFVIHTKASLFGKDDGKIRRLFSFVTRLLQMTKKGCILFSQGVIYNHKQTKGEFEK